MSFNFHREKERKRKHKEKEKTEKRSKLSFGFDDDEEEEEDDDDDDGCSKDIEGLFTVAFEVTKTKHFNRHSCSNISPSHQFFFLILNHGLRK